MHYVHSSKILPLKLSYIPFSAIPILLKNEGPISEANQSIHTTIDNLTSYLQRSVIQLKKELLA